MITASTTHTSEERNQATMYTHTLNELFELPFPDPHPPDPGPEPPPWDTIESARARRAAELALRMGDHITAERATTALLRAYPESIALRVLHARALLEAGRAELARTELDAILLLHPLDADAWAALAGALAALGDDAAAQTAIGHATSHDPLADEASNLVGGEQGILFLRRGHAEIAASALLAAIARAPAPGLQIAAAEALRRCGREAEAHALLAELPGSIQQSLPVLLLRIALDPASGSTLRTRIVRLDPDATLSRRFFAPALPPWQLHTDQLITRDADLAVLDAYLPLLPARPLAAEKALRIVAHHVPIAESTNTPEQVAPPVVDADLQSYIALTERLRHRVADAGAGARPLVGWAAGQQSSQLLLSSRAALTRRFGAAGFAAIDRALHQLGAALGRRGVLLRHGYFDDAASLALGDITLTPAAHDARAIRDLVRSATTALHERGRTLETLLLLGDDDIVPFHRLPNPLPDDDPLLLTDNPYGCDDAGFLLPQRIVARLPCGAGNDVQPLLALLDTMIASHSGSRAQRFWQRGRKSALTRSAGYAAEIWRGAAAAVLHECDPEAPLLTAPPFEADTLDVGLLGRRRLLYINLHGATGMPNFYGQPAAWDGPATRLPIALRPAHLATGIAAGTIVLSEACYGAELAGRTAATSIALRAFGEGALAYLGATVNAYGSSDTPLVAADLLFGKLMRHLHAGVALGTALHHARVEFAQEMYRRQGYLDDVDHKTLLEFVLMGDPWATISDTPAAAATLWTPERVVAVDRVPKSRPKSAITERELPRELVGIARTALARLLPGTVRAPLTIVAQPNPRRQRKGDAVQDLTFSANQSATTEDGYTITQTAHVTVRGSAIVKAAMTR